MGASVGLEVLPTRMINLKLKIIMKNCTYLIACVLLLLSFKVTGQSLVCHSVVGVSLGDDGVSSLTPEMVLVGGPYDFQSITIEPSSVSNSDLGVQEYSITQSTTGNTCVGALEVSDAAGEPLVCRSLIEVVLDEEGTADLTLGNVLGEGMFDYSDLQIAPEVITKSEESGVYTVTDIASGDSCWGSYTVLNIGGPTPMCFKVIKSIPPGENSVLVLAKDFNSGSYDNTTADENLRYTFTEVSPELDPDYDETLKSSTKLFTATANSGVLLQDVYVWDEDGNSSSCTSHISVIDPFGNGNDFVGFNFPNIATTEGESVCVPIFAENFECITSFEGTVIWDETVLRYKNVENISLTDASIQDFNTLGTSDGLLPFAWFEMTGISPVTLPSDVPLFEVCFDVIGIIGTESFVTLRPSPTEINVSAGDKNDPTSPTEALGWTVKDGIVSVEDKECDFSSIILPLPLIELSIGGVNEANVVPFVSPAKLISIFDFTFDDIYPTYSLNCPFIRSFSDEVTQLMNGDISVIRSWRILNTETTEIFSYQQTIIARNISTWICDILPNNAAFGDCESGHTDTDDVEWPADVSVSDHRLTPIELEAYSNVPIHNTRPIFFNTPDLYTATYEDLVVSLSQDVLFINRIWTVRRLDEPTLLWSYNQVISVDLEMLSGLVSASTISFRAIPEVLINDLVLTNQDGLAMTEIRNDMILSYQDAIDNGLTIRDFVLIQRHMLSIDSLSELESLAGDVNGDAELDGRDLIDLDKVLLGITSQATSPWKFYNRNDFDQGESSTTLIGKAQSHIGVKLGDVDDDAILNGELPVYNQRRIRFEDQLVNAGQDYKIPIAIDEAMDLSGIELSFDFDTTLYDLVSITTESFEVDPSYHISNGMLRVTVIDASIQNVLMPGDELIELTISAKQNSILSSGFSLSDSRRSLSLDTDLILEQLVGEIDGMISTNVFEQEIISFSAFPNPTSDMIFIETAGIELGDSYSLSLFDTHGRQILKAETVTALDISGLKAGMYLLVLESENERYMSKINVITP